MKAIRHFLTLFILGAASSLNAQISFLNLAHTNNGGTAQGIIVAGNYAYLASGTNGLLIYDISNPAQPIKAGNPHGTNDTGINATSLAISGNYVYLATPNLSPHSFCVYDVSNPSAPTNVFTTNLNLSGGGGMAVLGSNLYLGGDGFIAVMNISTPATPTLVTQYRPSSLGNPLSAAVSSNYLALASGANQLMNIGVFSNQVYTNFVATNVAGTASGVALSGQFVFVANGSSSPLESYLISPSGAVSRAGQITYPASPTIGHGVALAGNYAYLACSAGLRAIDVTDPANLKAVGQTSTNYGGTGLGVAVSGRYVYLANGTDGLRVFAIQPQLTVSNAPGNLLTFSWPDQGPFTLQQTADIGNPSWVTLTNIAVNGQLTLPPPASNMFYRLVGQ